MYKTSLLVLIATLLFTVGCGGERVPNLATVKGRLTLDGEPLDQIKVTFMPDAERGCLGRSAWGETNENGEYTLTYQYPEKPEPGAAIGWHKVVLRDLQPANSRDESGGQKPRRISGLYSNSPKTPLEFEVKEGENTFDVEVEPNE